MGRLISKSAPSDNSLDGPGIAAAQAVRSPPAAAPTTESDVPMTFHIDSRLTEDAEKITDLPLCRVLLAPDATYPWLILVPRRDGAVEIIDLSAEDRQQLMDEIALTSEVLKSITNCDKLNVAALGNMVPQLHVHVIARRKTDVAWPGPIWGVAEALSYDPVKLHTLCDALRHGLKSHG